ncbi:hypothetical protein D3C74_437430 [compost metagenome]
MASYPIDNFSSSSNLRSAQFFDSLPSWLRVMVVVIALLGFGLKIVRGSMNYKFSHSSRFKQWDLIQPCFSGRI